MLTAVRRGTIWSDENGKEVWKFDKRFYTDANLEIEARFLRWLHLL